MVSWELTVPRGARTRREAARPSFLRLHAVLRFV